MHEDQVPKNHANFSVDFSEENLSTKFFSAIGPCSDFCGCVSFLDHRCGELIYYLSSRNLLVSVP